jgi:putative membrane protein
MLNFIIRLIVNAIALLIVAYVVPGVHVDTFTGAIIAALVLGIVNAILRPLLFILTLPLQILTLGLFTLIINGFLFWLVAHLGIGLHVDGYWSAFLAAIVLSIVSFVLSLLLKEVERA